MKKAIVLMSLAALLAASSAAARVEVTPQGFFVEGKYFFPVGVNYMPRSSAIRMWEEFDPEEIRVEFRIIKEMGLNTVRTFIFWADLNPRPGEIDQEVLRRIALVMDIARDEGIMVIPTLNTGHMSGGNWYPPWMRVWTMKEDGVFQKERFRPPTLHLFRVHRDIYEDPLAVENGVLMAEVIAGALRDHPALLYYDLGNEPQYWQRPRLPELGREYVRRQVRAIKAVDPNHPVSLGMGKFAEDTGFHSYGEHGISAEQDLYLVHTYPAGYYPYSAKGIGVWETYYAGFETRLSQVAGLPVQFQEFGLSDQSMLLAGKQEKDLIRAGYYRTSLWSSQLAGAYAGAIAWMSGDYKRALIARDPYLSRPYELDFGVMDQHYELKPSGVELSKFARVIKELYTKPPTHVESSYAVLLPENYQEFPQGPDKAVGTFGDTHANHNRFLFSVYLAFRQLGVMPGFISPDQDFHGTSGMVVPAFSPLSENLINLLSDYLAAGNKLHFVGPFIPEQLQGRDGVTLSPDDLEIANALHPTDAGLAALRDRYAGLIGERWLMVDDPFVEAGVIPASPWTLVFINHRDYPVTATVDFGGMETISRCYYGTTPPAASTQEFTLQLDAYGVEVCEKGERSPWDE